MGIMVSAGQRFGGSGSSSCNSCHLGHENIIDCVSGIFLRKTHAGCGFFCCCKPHPQLVSDKNNNKSIPYKTAGMKGLAIKLV